MASSKNHKYKMALSLNVLNHLGIGLYSNVPAVLSEVVANAWDADAERVSIDIDSKGDKIIIQDDGQGMGVEDANQRYLLVGYERRKAGDGARTTRFGRPVMGRKGIGKLSLFSIARIVEVHSVKKNERHGFKMDLDQIEKAIRDGGEDSYFPDPVDDAKILLDKGTKIILTNMRRRLTHTSAALRRRLARRFSVIGKGHHFGVVLDGSPVRIEDRGYYDKLQYMWIFGDNGLRAKAMTSILEYSTKRSSAVVVGETTFHIDGWIGTVEKSGQLKDSDTNESMNKIVLMVRGKLAQEDILEEFAEGGLYTKYVIGEIHADFLDRDEEEDIAITSRQRIIEESPRYQALKSKLRDEMKLIQGEWTKQRNEGGRKKALEIPQIKKWEGQLNSDHKKAATKLFGRINQLPIDDPSEKRKLLISGILAFESFRLRNLLHRLDKVSVENLPVLEEVFIQLDDLEASAYYQIAKDRLEVIQKLTSLVDDNAKEKAIQEHLFNHLWLLDPSWERATHTERMETQINKALEGTYQGLSEEQRAARLDIYYATTAGKHVIIELKRASRSLNSSEVLAQIGKYLDAAQKVLESLGKGNEPIEFVCVIGRTFQDWNNMEERKS